MTSPCSLGESFGESLGERQEEAKGEAAKYERKTVVLLFVFFPGTFYVVLRALVECMC